MYKNGTGYPSSLTRPAGPKCTPPVDVSACHYVIVTAARDEAPYLGSTIESVAAQTLLPQQWVIVNDGSTDATAELATAAATKYPWISVVHRPDRGHRAPGSGVVHAFYAGYHAIRLADWDFLVKLDADLVLPPDYFETCCRTYAADPSLGITGGLVYQVANGRRVFDPSPPFHVRGALAHR
jgi:glycosyltransferase involved in cell wall biosynthesis